MKYYFSKTMSIFIAISIVIFYGQSLQANEKYDIWAYDKVDIITMLFSQDGKLVFLAKKLLMVSEAL
ncbi:hypothetical protein CVPH_1028 [Abyssogena phaseoliformis symbiont OG214]|uniref:hypothetical protein n=1 Tax=Abyssogena phaseoliformis symbiont TaxID=596095 RepID=UPI00191604A1|nr:hypothetical protein [Abyssogena phaseoliformis symbiont]BBB22968.1 hypothetical protein CVPH_1028 [Abyssogena phaseoliformis symbiont OG214]